MTRENFKVVDNPEYIKSCKTMIDMDGRCSYVTCRSNCPFNRDNSIDGKSCEGKYRSDDKKVLTANAKEFIKLFK